MTIELSGPVEKQLREIARRHGRDVGALIEEALRMYLDAVAITDVDAGDVAATQTALAPEISDAPEWNGERP